MPSNGLADAPVSSAPPARRPRPKHYHAEEQERYVKTYPFTTLEILTLSALNPVAAALLGWAVNLITSWSDMAAGKEKSLIFVSAIILFAAGIALQGAIWLILIRVWYECRKPA